MATDPGDASSRDASKVRLEVARLLESCQATSLTDADLCAAEARKAYELASSIGEISGVGRSLYWLGTALRQNADLLNAADMLRQSLETLRSCEDMGYVPRALQGLGAIHSASGELELAAKCFAEGLAIARGRNDNYTIQRILNSWAIVYIRIADYTKALELAEECLRSLEELPDPYLESSILMNIGAVYQRTGDYPTSISYCQRSLAIGRELEDYRHICASLIFLGDNYIYSDRLEDARAAAMEVNAIAARKHFADYEALSLKALADIALKQSDAKSGIDFLLHALDLLQATGNALFEQQVEVQIGNGYTSIGNFVEAKRHFIAALDLAEKVNSPQRLAETHEALAEYYRKIDDPAACAHHLRESIAWNKKLFTESNTQALRDLERRRAIEVNKQEAELERLRSEELQKTNLALNELSKRQAEILKVVSHDMRNPISAIIGLSESLRRDDELDLVEAKRFFGIIHESAESLLQLVEQLLFAANLESGTLELDPTDINLYEVLSGIQSLIRPLAEHKQITLEFEVPNITVVLDLECFKHILNNLLSNAIKFTSSSGTVGVHANFDHVSKLLRIRVTDTGIGIPSEQLAELFERFKGLQRKGTNQEEGTGLGLSIVKQLCDLMSATINVESSPSGGTVFLLEFPVG